MTDCHQPTGVEARLLSAFHGGTLVVTGSEVVTHDIAVTRETIGTQARSSLSPVSPLKSLSLHLRAIGVWGCRLSPVTVVTGDNPAQSVRIPPTGVNSSETFSPGTARIPKLSFLHIKILISSICKKLPLVRGSA
jgi:hypothetical protein